MQVTGFSGGIRKSDQAHTYEQLNSWVELNSLRQTENLLILQSIIFLQPLTHSFFKIAWVLFFFITLKTRHLLALQSHLPFFFPLPTCFRGWHLWTCNKHNGWRMYRRLWEHKGDASSSQETQTGSRIRLTPEEWKERDHRRQSEEHTPRSRCEARDCVVTIRNNYR